MVGLYAVNRLFFFLEICVVLAYPVEGHISTVFEDVVIGMAQNSDVAVSRSALRTELMQGMLGMRRIASQGLINLESKIRIQTFRSRI